MLDWILILLGIILTQTAILYYKFSDRAKGYMLRAAASKWPFFVCVFIIETIFAVVLAELGSKFIPLPRYLLLLLVAILVVLLPNTFEYFILYRNVTEKKVRNPLVKAIRKLNLAIVHQFGGAIRTCMEQDVYDIQAGRLLQDINNEEMGRRIRKIYTCHAQEIARKRRKPELMRRDAGFWPIEQLYLLCEHLGRKRLMYELRNPPPLEWDGEERRRRRKGTRADRLDPAERNSLRSRAYDDDDEDDDTPKQLGVGKG
jgi:hypothetical protein